VLQTLRPAYRSLARCDDPERFGAWLYGILVNRAARPARAPRAGAPLRARPRALETAPLAGPDGRASGRHGPWALALPSIA